MTPDRVALRTRIGSFDIEGGVSPLPFAARLARAHGWSRSYAERVIVEYRRYVFLAVTGTEPVCPAEDVDAAWHLHLTYTRSYWQRFCGEVLGRPLHHEPTRGGPAEARKHHRMYEATLARYRDELGEEPPADIWPATATRFGDDICHRVVNTARNWVIPKLPVKRVAGFAALLAVLTLFAPGCAGRMNPFNLESLEFLGFLIPVMISAVLLGRVIRSGLRKPDPESGDDELEFTWEQTAYLAGGYPRLTTAAIARLVEREFAAVASDSERLVPGGKLPAREDLSPAEHAVYSALPFGNKPADLKPVHEAVEAAFSTRASRLEDDGFVLPRERQVALALASLAPLLLVLLAFAVPRLVMGLAHDKPVTFLVIAGIMGLVFGIPFCVGRTIRLTYRGENLLVWLRAKHGSLTTSGAADAAMGVALFGTAALAVSSIPFLQTWYPRQTSDAGGGCGSGCGSGDGGGGCGGGGCGGCGGD